MCRCHFLFTITLHCSYRESFVRDKHIGCFTEQLVCSNIRVHSVGDPLLLLITVPEATHALLKAKGAPHPNAGGVQISNPCNMDYSN